MNTSILYETLLLPLRKARSTIYDIIYRGDNRYCPVCERTFRLFLKGGLTTIRKDARCPHCNSYERYRLVWLYIKRKTNLFDKQSKQVLHVAPEKCFGNIIKNQIGTGYLSADLYNPLAMEKMDITNIRYPNESFDVIYCNHVLEHVSDDRKALREFFRVLKNNGWTLLQVPINLERTFEDPSVIDPAMRLKIFGQKDHVRSYGHDFVERVEEAGFKVKTISPSDFLSSEEITRMGIAPKSAGKIFYCTKQ